MNSPDLPTDGLLHVIKQERAANATLAGYFRKSVSWLVISALLNALLLSILINEMGKR
jgi:hypothetical protein